MSNAIIRAPRTEHYSIVQTSVIRDEKLSYRARGVLIRLLSNVDGFRMNSRDLAREGVEGRDAIRRVLNELKSQGYIRSTTVRNEKGHFVTETYVYDKPQPTDVVDKPQAKPDNQVKKLVDDDGKEVKKFGNFKIKFVKESEHKGRFDIGAALMAKFKKDYPGVAAENQRYTGMEGYLAQVAQVFLETSERNRNQVVRGNWTLRKWVTWKLDEEQNFIGDIAAFGLKEALRSRNENRG